VVADFREKAKMSKTEDENLKQKRLGKSIPEARTGAKISIKELTCFLPLKVRRKCISQRDFFSRHSNRELD